MHDHSVDAFLKNNMPVINYCAYQCCVYKVQPVYKQLHCFLYKGSLSYSKLAYIKVRNYFSFQVSLVKLFKKLVVF